MDKISREKVLEIAKLAKLTLSETEIESMQDQLGRILDHFQAIEQVDTSAVPAMKHVLAEQNVFRDDVPRRSLSQEEALKNAPSTRDGLFEVPKVLDKN